MSAENINIIKSMAIKLNVPISILNKDEIQCKVFIYIRENVDFSSSVIPVGSIITTFESKQSFTKDPKQIENIFKQAADKILNKEPFKSIHKVQTLMCKDPIAKYITAGNVNFIATMDKLNTTNGDNPLPFPRVEATSKMDLVVSFTVSPKITLNMATQTDQTATTSTENSSSAPEIQFNPTFIPGCEPMMNSYQIPKHVGNILQTMSTPTGVKLITSLNVFTTKIVRTVDGRVFVFEPRLKDPLNVKGDIVQPISSQQSDNVQWIQTKVFDSPVVDADEKDLDNTTKVSQRKPAALRDAPNETSDDSSGPSDDEEDSDNSSYCDEQIGTDKHVPFEHHSMFFPKDDGKLKLYGEDSIYKDAITTYQLNYPDFQEETIEFIKLLPMKDVYNMFISDPSTFPSDKQIYRRLIHLYYRSTAFYRLYTKEQLKKMTPTELSHIYIAQMATNYQQNATIASLDHCKLAQTAVKNYKLLYPQCKHSTLERIRELPYPRLIQIFFRNRLPPRYEVIDMIDILMSYEDKDKDHVNYLFRNSEYMENLPTETLHRIFFIKLTFERNYYTAIPANDPFDEDFHTQNSISRNANLSALDATRPLQTLKPKWQEGDDIPEPEEPIRMQAPLTIRQYLIDEERRKQYIKALELNDRYMGAPPDTEEEMCYIQKQIFERKWPNYNTTLNFFRPKMQPDLSPAVINQLDSLPHPEKYFPNCLHTARQERSSSPVTKYIDDWEVTEEEWAKKKITNQKLREDAIMADLSNKDQPGTSKTMAVPIPTRAQEPLTGSTFQFPMPPMTPTPTSTTTTITLAKTAAATPHHSPAQTSKRVYSESSTEDTQAKPKKPSDAN
jgi:hypothetical protein